jgi:hypothetical protein
MTACLSNLSHRGKNFLGRGSAAAARQPRLSSSRAIAACFAGAFSMAKKKKMAEMDLRADYAGSSTSACSTRWAEENPQPIRELRAG